MRHKSASFDTSRTKKTIRGLKRSDVLIVGGNHAGLSLATLLGTLGLTVVCLERNAAKPKSTKTKSVKSTDGRTVALSLRSVQLLRQANVWPLFAGEACPINVIRIADQDSPATLDFDYRDVGDEAFGWIVENRLFLQALHAHIAKLKNVAIVTGAAVSAIDTDDAGATVTLDDGRGFAAPLVIGADGRNSVCRRLAEIPTYGWDYDQTALICNIAHAQPHHHIAVEHFLPGGPFAVLPMTDGAKSGPLPHRSSIVWTESTAAAATLMQLNDADFTLKLKDKVAPYLGDIKIINARQSYPLQLQHARRYTAPRLALIGDAAHGIHPIAGQGFNLGMGDIAVLADELTRAKRLGLDLGSPDTLRRFEKRRKTDNGNMVLATDLLDRLFSNALPPVQAARRFGLGMVQRLPRLKQFFMRTAMGLGSLKDAA